MEDTATGDIAGVCGIETAVGLEQPFYNYRVSTVVHASQDLGVWTQDVAAQHLARPDRLRGSVFAVPEPALSHGGRRRFAVALALHVYRAVSRALPAAFVRGIARPFR